MSRSNGQALASIFAKPGPGTLARSAPPPAESGATAFLAVVDRVEAVLDAETQALSQQVPIDFTEIGNRKRQGLLDMSRMLKGAIATGAVPDVRERIARFSVALDRNRAALGTRLRAVREVAEIVAQVIRDAESDGTYSPRMPRS